MDARLSPRINSAARLPNTLSVAFVQDIGLFFSGRLTWKDGFKNIPVTPSKPFSPKYRNHQNQTKELTYGRIPESES